MDIIYIMQREMFRRGMSNKTVLSYSSHIKHFFMFCKKEPRKITKRDIKAYLEHLSLSGKSSSTQNLHYSALKFMVSEILFKNWNLRFRCAKKQVSLPTVMTKKEISVLLDTIENKKHRLMVSLTYGAGLRVSEIVHLKVCDIDDSYGWVRHGKGDKDRLFIIPEKLRNELKERIAPMTYNSYIFLGNKNTHVSQRTFYHIVKKYAKIAGIKKNIHPHTLRHSFATHLVEDGNDLFLIQRLMGHNNLETTKGYIHLAVPRINIKSPLDTLNQ